MEDLVRSLALTTQQHIKESKSEMQELKGQMSHLASAVSKLENQGRLPSQPDVNPRQNASAVTLRSKKELQVAEKENDNTRRGHTEPEATVEKATGAEKEMPEPQKPPFPHRLAKKKKGDDEKEIWETFKKVEINIPLLTAIRQVPRYAKFLKELCVNRNKLQGNERVNMGENVSAIIQKKLPQKCKDPGMFAISCKIGNVGMEKAMCDLGASINVMPLSIYNSLNIGPLKPTGVVLTLADRSSVFPEGILEDVLVQVDDLVFPADFYVLNMEDDGTPNSRLLLLGRPFLKTAHTKIDVHAGTLTMEFDGAVIKFSINDAMRHPIDFSSISVIDHIDPLANRMLELCGDDSMQVALVTSLTLQAQKEMEKIWKLPVELIYAAQDLEVLQPDP